MHLSLAFVIFADSLVIGCGTDDASHDDYDVGDAEVVEAETRDVQIACDATPPADPGPGEFWALCAEASDCASGWCLEAETDHAKHCHQICVTTGCCPIGYVCRWAPGPLDDQFLCFPE